MKRDNPKPAKMPSLEQLFHGNIFLPELFEKNESDRSIALIGGAMTDNFLEAALRHRLADNKSTDWLFALDGPLGTFKAKTHIAHSLGILTENHCHDINVIRDVRNLFAHTLVMRDNHIPTRLTFATQAIKSKCDAAIGIKATEPHESRRLMFVLLVCWECLLLKGNIDPELQAEIDKGIPVITDSNATARMQSIIDQLVPQMAAQLTPKADQQELEVGAILKGPNTGNPQVDDYYYELKKP